MTITITTETTADVTWTDGPLAGLTLPGFAIDGNHITFPDISVSMAPMERSDDDLRAISDALAPEPIRAAIRAAVEAR